MPKLKLFFVCLTLPAIAILGATSVSAEIIVQTNTNAETNVGTIEEDLENSAAEDDRPHPLDPPKGVNEDILEDSLENPADAYDRDLIEGNAEPGNQDQEIPLEDSLEGTVNNTN